MRQQQSSICIDSARNQSGFSLIELVAAFVIFALGFGVLLQILTGSINSAQRAADYTQAALWAQSKLDVLGIGERFKEGSTSGEFDQNYHWDLRVSKLQPTNDQDQTSSNDHSNDQGKPLRANPLQVAPGVSVAIDLYQLELNVHWGGVYHAHNARFVTLRASNPDSEVNNPAFPAPSSPVGGNKPP